MTTAFYWIGVAVVALLAVAVVGYAMLWLYFNAVHQRFNAILFRKGQRRLSIASWHHTKLLRKGESPDNLAEWPADDWPICEHPFYLSYRVGKRRIFVLAGTLAEHRNRSIEGTHP